MNLIELGGNLVVGHLGDNHAQVVDLEHLDMAAKLAGTKVRSVETSYIPG